MAKAQAQAPHDRSTTQRYLDIHDITNDFVIMRDGGVSVVLQVNAINFGLLSEPEQDAIIYAYAALINSLSFPIQIVIKSQPKDVTRYLEYIDQQQNQANSELRRRQITQYRQFVANLITEQNVLDKTFFTVLPLTALEVGLPGSINPFSSMTDQNKDVQFDKYYVLEKAKNILIPRRDHMISQFARLGLQARQLNTKELIHLFYVAYNAEAAEGARIVDTREYTTALIQTQNSGQLTGMQPAAPQVQPGSNAPAASGSDSPAEFISPPTAQPQPMPAQQAPQIQPIPSAASMNSPLPPESGQTPNQFETVNNGTNMNLDNVSAIPQEQFVPTQAQPGQPR